MTRKKFDRDMYVRTTDRARLALKRLVTELGGSGIQFQGRIPTQEAILNASWLWMEELGADFVRAGIEKHLRMLEGDPVALPVDETEFSTQVPRVKKAARREKRG